MSCGLQSSQLDTPKIEKILKHPALSARALNTDPGAQTSHETSSSKPASWSVCGFPMAKVSISFKRIPHLGI